MDESLFFNFGGRFNYPEEFDSRLVGEASAAYLFKDFGTKIHGHIGSGYRTPSLYEIYGGYLSNGNLITIGNPDLKPEESLGYEFGVEQAVLGEKVKVGLTWFHTDFDQLITYDGLANRYANADRARSEGIETYLAIAPWKWMRLNFAYTYADSEVEDKEQWVRRTYLPRNKVSSVVTFLLPCDLTTSLRVSWQDEKIVPLYDPNFNSVRWEEPSVVTVDAAATYTFLKRYSAFLRVENILDEDYTESGYVMAGRSVLGGVKLTF
jgi:vitamin B12 transporter